MHERSGGRKGRKRREVALSLREHRCTLPFLPFALPWWMLD
jgi:hypothetical protein